MKEVVHESKVGCFVGDIADCGDFMGAEWQRAFWLGVAVWS